MRAAWFACLCLVAGCPDGGGGTYEPDPLPVARPDHVTIAEDTSFLLDELSVNDDFVEDIVVQVKPAHGALTNSYDYSTYRYNWRYVADPGYYGVDRFTYVGVNDSGETEEVQVMIQITSDGVAYEQSTMLASGSGGDVAIADIDGDGQNDVVHTEYDTIRILLTESTAPRTIEAIPLRFEGGRIPYAVEVADLDGDGWTDIVVAGGTDGVVMLRNRGGGVVEFDAPMYLPAGQAVDVAVLDLDGDGKLDIASVDSSGDAMFVRLNASTPGALAFGVAYSFATPDQPSDIVTGDADRAGGPDLIVTSYESSSMSIYVNAMALGDSVPAFSSRIDRATGDSPNSILVVDLDGDGLTEIAVVHWNDLWIYANRSPSGDATGFIAARVLDLPYTSRRIAALDVDGSGPLDLVIGAGRYAPLTTLVNRTTPTGGFAFESFEPEVGEFGQRTVADLGETYGLATGDLDGTGRPELVVTGTSGTFVLFE